MQFCKMKGFKNIIDDRFISGPLSFGLSGSLGAPAFFGLHTKARAVKKI